MSLSSVCTMGLYSQLVLPLQDDVGQARVHLHAFAQQRLVPFELDQQVVVLHAELRELLVVHLLEHARGFLRVLQEFFVGGLYAVSARFLVHAFFDLGYSLDNTVRFTILLNGKPRPRPHLLRGHRHLLLQSVPHLHHSLSGGGPDPLHLHPL